MMINLKIITVGEYRKIAKEKKFKISFAVSESPLGKCCVGLFENCICHLSFVTSRESENIEEIKKQWPGAELFCGEGKKISKMIDEIFRSKSKCLNLVSKGTSFQAKVWRALLNIPCGETKSYSDLAKDVGKEKAVRAVANAVAKNCIAYLIPCHRVIKKDGKIHKYRWGESIKKKILEFEKVTKLG